MRLRFATGTGGGRGSRHRRAIRCQSRIASFLRDNAKPPSRRFSATIITIYHLLSVASREHRHAAVMKPVDDGDMPLTEGNSEASTACSRQLTHAASAIVMPLAAPMPGDEYDSVTRAFEAVASSIMRAPRHRTSVMLGRMCGTGHRPLLQRRLPRKSRLMRRHISAVDEAIFIERMMTMVTAAPYIPE